MRRGTQDSIFSIFLFFYCFLESLFLLFIIYISYGLLRCEFLMNKDCLYFARYFFQQLTNSCACLVLLGFRLGDRLVRLDWERLDTSAWMWMFSGWIENLLRRKLVLIPLKIKKKKLLRFKLRKGEF